MGQTHFYFVRHGRTQWNVEGRVQGGGNLDEVGVAQVCALARRLASHQFEAVYASPLPRTRQTAAIVAGALGLPVRLHFLLRDLDYGETAGMLTTELRAQYPDLWERLRTAPETVEFPGASQDAGSICSGRSIKACGVPLLTWCLVDSDPTCRATTLNSVCMHVPSWLDAPGRPVHFSGPCWSRHREEGL